MPTIKEGEVIEEFRTRDEDLDTGIDDYPKDMDAYRNEGMGDIIVGKPFLREVGIKTKCFEGIITLYNGDDKCAGDAVDFKTWLGISLETTVMNTVDLDGVTCLNGAIPTKTAEDAKKAIQEMTEYSQKWHNGASRGRSTETFDRLAALQAQLNNLGREIKKVNEKVHVA
ncbi:hypothetical protein Tco_0138424 [Tanacetum coccineum]